MASETDSADQTSAGPLPAAIGTIRLERVDFHDSAYRITTCGAIGELSESFRRLGLLVPPLLRMDGDRLVIVSGFRRLSACRRLGIDRLTARVMPADADHLECARCAVAENALQRPLNIVETSRAIALLAAALPEGKSLAGEAAAAGLPSNPDMIGKLLRVGRLPSAMQARLLDGSIGLSMALALGDLEPAFDAACAELFAGLRVGLNRQREMLVLLTEIAARDGLTPLALLEDPGIKGILADDHLAVPQKAGLIRDWLCRRRYPRIERAERDFERDRRRLKLGRHIHLTPPPYFEDDTYTLRLEFKDVTGLLELIRRLERISADPAMNRILSRSQDPSTG